MSNKRGRVFPMKKIISLIFVCLLVFSCSSNKELELSDDVAKSISRIETGLMKTLQIAGTEPVYHDIDSRLKKYAIPGLSVAVSHNDKVLWSKAYGMADVKESRPMTTKTMLLAGSISKPVAALRALQLHEQGRFLLDENVNNYLTSWSVPDNQFTETEKVTLRRILNHSAGLTVWGFPGYDKGDLVPSAVEVLDGKGNTDAVRVYKTPGESWQYSGGGYTAMQVAIGDIEKFNFSESMQTHVLNPLKMNNSTYENPLPEKYHTMAATGYRENGQEVEGKWPIYPEMAAAGLWTTPSELIQYGIEIQQIINSKRDGIIEYKTALEMLSPGDNDHGLGPIVKEYFFRHGGADEGFRASFIGWRNSPYAAVVMVNSDNGAIIQEVMLAIAKEYGLAGIEPTIKEVTEISFNELQKYVGQYDAGTSGIFEITLSDQGLSVFAKNYEYTTTIIPESPTIFFEDRNGRPLNFTITSGLVEQFEWRGIVASRLPE